MPRIKKTTVADKVESLITPEVEIAATIAEEGELTAEDNTLDIVSPKEKKTSKRSSKSTLAPTVIPDIPIPELKVRKPKFKEIHIKDSYWVENDIYQTIADMTKGNKGAKALIINQALKDYLKKNKIEIVPFINQDKHKKP
ncbi:hypothetical protein [Pelosinus sp. sgz500959]|uniref:hypothetical protein n=1 Tax=Pelosinus sp. sgz500959 TaxID=3242472 RepID=UPI00366F1AD3